MQPYRPQVSPPDGKVGGGVQFFADADTRVYQFVFGFVHIGCRCGDSQYIQCLISDRKVGDCFYRRTGIRQYLI